MDGMVGPRIGTRPRAREQRNDSGDRDWQRFGSRRHARSRRVLCVERVDAQTQRGAAASVLHEPPASQVGVGEAREPLRGFEPGKAGRLPGLDAPEECGKGQIKPAQRLLQGVAAEIHELGPSSRLRLSDAARRAGRGRGMRGHVFNVRARRPAVAWRWSGARDHLTHASGPAEPACRGGSG